MVDSPAYRLNHEEVIKALEEGISFIENVNPEEAIVDEHNHVRAMRFAAPGRSVELAARAVLVAAGTTPNITYEKEYPGSFQMDDKKKFFAAYETVPQSDGSIKLQASPNGRGFFTSYSQNGRFVTYYGDNHPRYAGNVVKAMASARDGFPRVVALFAGELSRLNAANQAERDARWRKLTDFLDAELIARAERVARDVDGLRAAIRLQQVDLVRDAGVDLRRWLLSGHRKIGVSHFVPISDTDISSLLTSTRRRARKSHFA